MPRRVGDASAEEIDWIDLYRKLEKPLYNVVYRWLWHAADSQDVVQDAFIALLAAARTRSRRRREELDLPYGVESRVEPSAQHAAVALGVVRHVV
jgi:DNA-directed RNA polymerase specialized sigma24 family protein